MNFAFLKDRRTLVWIGLSVLLLLIAGFVIVYFFLPGFGLRGHAVDIEPLPGLIDDNRFDEDLIVPGIWQRIGDRLYGSVSTGESDVLLPFAAFTVTKTRMMKDTVRSDVIQAEDVLLYMQALAEQGRRGDFLTLQRAFDDVFVRGTHPVTKISVEDGVVTAVGAEDYALWFAYEKALILGFSRWPEATLEQTIRRGIDQLKPLFSNDELGKPVDLPDDVMYPWVSTDIQPTPPPHLTGESIVIFSDVDLYVLRQLAAFEPELAAYADHWTKEIATSIASVGAPFPAYAAWADSGDYIAVQKESFIVDTSHVLRTLLHLVESGETVESSLDFFRQRLLDGLGISTAYRVADGSAAGEPAAVDLYALLARIGRAADDAVLTEAAHSAMARFYAGSQTSLIFGAYYRDAPDNAFDMRLSDNAWALLALR